MKVLVLGGAGAQGYYAIEKMAADDIYPSFPCKL